jgi:glycosyltransferase involved in cell wall biosynthesis
MMRIALDTSPLHGHRTGVAVAAAELLRGLRSRPDVEPLPYVVSLRARLDAGERRLGLPAAAATRVWSRFDRPRADRWLGDADVVHGTNYAAPPSRLPTVISVYDCWFLAHPDLASAPVARAGRALQRAAQRGATIHVSSHATADQARSLLGTDRIEVIHLGPPRREPPEPDHTAVGGATAEPPTAVGSVTAGAPFIAAIGTVERRKGIGDLVDAFALIGAHERDLHLVIAGAPGDDQHRVEQRIQATPAHVRSRIHLLGAISAATKDRVLAEATALVYPSLDEGFGFPILEAQSHDLCVVGTRAGSIPEVGGDGIELCNHSDPSDLARAIANVVTDSTRRTDLVAAGRANLQRFDWNRTLEGFVTLYRRVIKEH